MARKKHSDFGSAAATQVVVPLPPSSDDAQAPKRAGSRCFLVRCVDPTLYGYVVRGVRIPQGGDAIVRVEEKHVRDVLADRAVVCEEIDE